MVYKQYSVFSNNSIDQRDVSLAVRGSPYVAAMKIHEVMVPLAFNTTDSSNNTLVFERAGSVKSTSIPAGNYSAATFPTALQKALNDASTVKDFVVSWDELTRRLTVSAGSPFTIHPFGRGTTMYRQLGMSKYSQPNTGTSVTLGVSDFTNTSPLLLVSTRLNSKDMAYLGDENCNVLCMVNTSVPQGSVAQYINCNGSYCSVGSELPSLDLRLLNASTLLPVQLSQPFSVTFSILTDEDDQIVYH